MIITPHYYIKVENDIPFKQLYTDEEASNIISVENNIILSSHLTDEIYNSFNFYKVNLVLSIPAEIDYLDTHYLEIIPTNIISITKALDNTYDVVVEVKEHIYLLTNEWEQLRSHRNQLLQTTDWIENSVDVTIDTKNKYKAYRNYLRDITDIYALPNQVFWVKSPEIKYIVEKHNDTYSPEGLEKIRNYVPANKDKEGWNSFLTAWEQSGFIDSILGVNSLIHMHLTITASGTTFNINEVIQ